MGVLNSDGLLNDVASELCPQRSGSSALHVGPLHGDGSQGYRPLLHYSWLPHLVVHRHSPVSHVLIHPLCYLVARRPLLMGLGGVGPLVARLFGLRSTKEARAV